MRKVCIVISNLNIGGAELSMYKILFELKNDFNFIIVSLSQGGLLNKDLEKLGIKIYSLDFRNHFLKSVWRLYYVLKNEKPDVVHTWMYHSDLIGGILAKFANIKFIIWGIRNTDLIKGTTVITRLIGIVNAVLSYFIPDKILVVSNSSMIKHSKLKYCTRKMTVIPNGFSSTKKISQKESILFRAQLGFEPSSMLIGSVGRFNEYKDHRTFIEAALILLDLVEGTYNLNFLIIGKNVDNLFLINLIQGTPYVNRFHFFDETNYINKYYSILIA